MYILLGLRGVFRLWFPMDNSSLISVRSKVVQLGCWASQRGVQAKNGFTSEEQDEFQWRGALADGDDLNIKSKTTICHDSICPMLSVIYVSDEFNIVYYELFRYLACNILWLSIEHIQCLGVWISFALWTGYIPILELHWFGFLGSMIDFLGSTAM